MPGSPPCPRTSSTDDGRSRAPRTQTCSCRSCADSPTVPTESLAATVRGAGDRLVLVHGFTQTGRSWDRVAASLSDGWEVVTVDAPGHGDSAAVRADLPAAAAMLGTAGGAATYVGYSMGGRLCLHLALAPPAPV